MILPNRVTSWVNKDGYCHGCNERLGAPHKPDCVNYKKTVIIEFTIPLLVEAPVSWGKDDIEFKYGESSFCLNSLVDDINQLKERLDMNSGTCFCSLCWLTENGGVSFVREATEQDHDEFKVNLPQNIEDLP